jgi:ATP-dependent DNA helicase RecG
VQQVTNAHGRDLTLLFRRLVEDGFLVPHGERRGRSYSVASEADSPATSVHNASSSVPNAPSSVPNAPSSVPNASSSVPNASSSVPNAPSSVPNAPSSVPNTGPLVHRVASSQRARPKEVRAAILALCAGTHLTAAELAARLAREPSKLRLHYLTPMVREGLLALRYPESPTHPDQGYIAKERAPR